MIGTTNNKGDKAKIEVFIPPDSLGPLKDEFEHKTIDKLLKLNKEEVPSSPPYTITLDKFHIQRISENNVDKTQVIESNEFPMFFAFGKGAETHQYQLNVLDGKENLLGEDGNWLKIYEDFYEVMRPHTILDYELKMSIYYSDKVIHGIWYNMNYDKNSQNDKVVGVNFKFFVISKERRAEVG